MNQFFLVAFIIITIILAYELKKFKKRKVNNSSIAAKEEEENLSRANRIIVSILFVEIVFRMTPIVVSFVVKRFAPDALEAIGPIIGGGYVLNDLI